MATVSKSEYYVVSIILLVATLATGQYYPPPAAPPTSTTSASWHWGQPPGQPAQWVWGVKDPSGMIHPQPLHQSPPQTSVGHVDQTGAINYGLNMGDIAKEGTGTTVYASSAAAEAEAFDAASKPCPDDSCNNPLAETDWFGIKHEIRVAVLTVVLAIVLIACVAFLVKGRK